METVDSESLWIIQGNWDTVFLERDVTVKINFFFPAPQPKKDFSPFSFCFNGAAGLSESEHTSRMHLSISNSY